MKLFGVNTAVEAIHVTPIKKKLTSLGESAARFASLFFQNLACCLSQRWQAIRWNNRNFSRLRQLPPFFWRLPYFFSEKLPCEQPFQELKEKYCVLQGCSVSAFKKHINQKLKKGCCHGECLLLVEQALKDGISLSELIPKLKASASRIALFQILEIFRETFERFERNDLAQIGKNMQPTCEAAIPFDVLSERRGLGIVRSYNQFSSHSTIFELQPERGTFGFYNNALGYYEYASFRTFKEEYLAHLQSRYPFHDHSIEFFLKD